MRFFIETGPFGWRFCCPFCGHAFRMHWKRCENTVDGDTDAQCGCSVWFIGWIIRLAGIIERGVRRD
jgi:hypothetical protein